MESDYGWSAIEDDVEEEYSRHDVTDTVDSNYETLSTSENYDQPHFEIKSEKVRASSLIRSQKALESKKSGVKRKRRRLTGAEEFFQLILSWSIQKLQLNNRKDIGLAALAEMPSYFSNGLLYYDTMRQVAVEEARACLTQGLITTLGKMDLKLSKVDSSMEDGQLVLIIFRILKGSLELTRPGSVFKLHSSIGNSFKSGIAENQGASNNAKPLNASKRSSSVSNDKATQHSAETTLAVVAQGSQAMKLVANSGGFSTALPLWVHSSSAIGKHLISTADESVGTTWTAVSIGSVLSYQRMASVCSDAPSPPFINKLLGHRPISHIKFDSDSDSDSEGESEVDGKSDLISKRQSPIVGDGSYDDDIEEVSFDSCDDTESVSSEDSDEPVGFLAHLSAKSSNKMKTLNQSQLAALHACLGAVGSGADSSAAQTLRVQTGNLHLILGPPGCGKTHFLVAMLHALIARSSFSSRHGDDIDSDDGDWSVKARIMVCAPSNKAVCVVLEQFLQSGVVGGTMSKGKRKEKDKEVGWVRCALIGVMDKLEGCSTDLPTRQCEQMYPRPLLPAALTDLTQRFLHPFCAADVFVSTYAKGISDVLSAVMHCLMEIASPQMLVLSDRAKLATAQSHSSVVELRGSILHLSAVLSALHSELLSLMRLVELDADYFYKKRLKLHWLRASETFKDLIGTLMQMLVDIGANGPLETRSNGPRGNSSSINDNSDSDIDSDSGVDEGDVDCDQAPSGQSVPCASTASNRQDVSHAKEDLHPGVESAKKGGEKKGAEEVSEKDDSLEVSGDNWQQGGKYTKEWDIVETDPIINLIRNLRIMGKELSSPSAGEEVAAAVLQSAAIVFCTLTSAGSGLVKKNVYGVDVLVVDEAAQALEVELLIPLSAAPKNLILVGDPKQLPACVLSMENQRTRRGESAMQRLMERCAYPSLLLDTQYRMHPAISMLPNRLFYEGRLFDSNHLIKRPNIFSAASRGWSHRAALPGAASPATTSALPRWLQHYTFIDVPGTEVGGGQGGTSLSNSAEASAVVK